MTASAAGPILVTGGSGQVGGAVANLLRRKYPDRSILAPGRGDLDISSPESIRACTRKAAPQWIISTAAYTAVDAAETDRDAAYGANATAPSILAQEAKSLGAGMIHLSTDYVFDGSGTRAWVESDSTNPCNVYGASKLAGEQAIAASSVPHVILRTSWVYSDGGRNFVRTMLRLLATKTDPLRVVADQHGGPTAAADLAATIVAIIKWSEARAEIPAHALANVSGIYHCAGSGETTWAGLAGAVRDFLEQELEVHLPEIIPVPSSAYHTPAARPLNSRLNCAKLLETFGVCMPQWEKSVTVVCRALADADLPLLHAQPEPA